VTEIEIKEIKRDFNYQYELKEFAQKLNLGYSEGNVYKIYSMSLVEILCKYYNFEVIKVELISNYPAKKVRYLRKKTPQN